MAGLYPPYWMPGKAYLTEYLYPPYWIPGKAILTEYLYPPYLIPGKASLTKYWSDQSYSWPYSSATSNAYYGSRLMAPAGSAGEFFNVALAAGIPPEAAFDFLNQLDLTSLATFIAYIRVAMQAELSPQQLSFHFELLRLIDPSQYDNWRKLLQEVRHKCELSNDTRAFVTNEEVRERLHSLLLQRIGIEQLTPLTPRVYQVAFLRSLFQFLEDSRSLLYSDPNVSLVFQAVNRYGSIQDYYAHHPAPRRAVQRMIELGFNVDYLVFGSDEIVSLGPSAGEPGDTWATRLLTIVKRILGSREEKPALDLAIDRHKFFHDIQTDYEGIKQHADRDAGLRVIYRLLPELERRQGTLLRNGDIIGETELQQCTMDLVNIRNELNNVDGFSAQRLVAIRSPKLLPELLFDNTRLSCCLFKPNGMFHGEICRLILDPATFLIEFRLEPFPEFLGLATLYIGVDAHGRRTILMDSVDYNDQLHDLRGYNGTMRFMLEAMAIDAHRAGAETLTVFAAPWGKPLNLANFVKQQEPRFHSISYHGSYYFESVDPNDSALQHSLAGQHHYTEAFGYLRSLSGVIDYGFNLIGPYSVDKLLSGGRGVYEIDVEAFLREAQLLQPASADITPISTRLPAPVSERLQAAIYERPSWHSEEIALREQRIFEAAVSTLTDLGDVRLKVLRRPDENLLTELVAADRDAFSPYLSLKAKIFSAADGNRLKQEGLSCVI